jgi:hypothetical protein
MLVTFHWISHIMAWLAAAGWAALFITWLIHRSKTRDKAKRISAMIDMVAQAKDPGTKDAMLISIANEIGGAQMVTLMNCTLDIQRMLRAEIEKHTGQLESQGSPQAFDAGAATIRLSAKVRRKDGQPPKFRSTPDGQWHRNPNNN